MQIAGQETQDGQALVHRARLHELRAQGGGRDQGARQGGRASSTCSTKCWCRPRRSSRCKRGRKVQAERKFLPGYVLVKMEMTDAAFMLIKNTPKVTGFLGADNKPIADLGRRGDAHPPSGEGRRGAARSRRSPSRSASRCRVADGPFASFRAHVEEVDERAFAAQGGGVDLRPADAGRAGVRPGREGAGLRLRGTRPQNLEPGEARCMAARKDSHYEAPAESAGGPWPVDR